MQASTVHGTVTVSVLILLALIPLGSAFASTSVSSAEFPVEIRPCSSQYQSFQLWINGQPARKCFVILDEGAEDNSSTLEVRQCRGENSAQIYYRGRPLSRCFVWT